jgi:prepilin-type processing-associated H-X9-DG protein
MKKRTGLTRIDLVVAVACVVFVLANVPIIIAAGRGRAKQEVCMANLRALTAAWTIYADDNAGKIVNGGPMIQTTDNCPNCPTGSQYRCIASPPFPGSINQWDCLSPTFCHCNELPWIGPAWSTQWWAGVPAEECCQKCAIETGALWKYLKNYGVYRCPTGDKGGLVTYPIIDSMNGMQRSNVPVGTGWIKNINQIKKPARRIVFLDEEVLSPDSYAVYYDQQSWFEAPCARHDNGANVSFADGHAEYWKWKAQETVDAANQLMAGYTPTTDAGKQDLYKMQIACYGQLGYTPSIPPDPNW